MKNLKMIMAVVLKTLGISGFSKDGSGNISLSTDQQAKLTDVFGADFTTKFVNALSTFKDDASAISVTAPTAAAGVTATMDSESTAESLMDSLRAHNSQVVANSLTALQAQLQASQSQNATLQETVNALSAAPESDPAAETPSAAIAGKPGVPVVMKVDRKNTLYSAATAFLGSGIASAYQAATIEVGDLRTEFGKYLSQNGNNLEIIRQLFNGFTSSKYFTTVMATTEYRAIRALITSVSQQFTAKWTPGGKAKFTPFLIKNFRHKINYPIIPAEVLDSYMFHLYDERLSPDQMPITKYIWDNLVYPALLQDIELRMIWKGKFVDHAPTLNEGDAAPAPEDSMDGLETILVEAKASGAQGVYFFNKYPNFDFKTATNQEILDFVEDFVDWISPMYKGMTMPLFVSDEFRKRYKRAYKKIWGTNSGQAGDFGSDKIDFSNNMLEAPDGMYSSPIIFSTPKQNMIKLRHKNEVPNVINDVQKHGYEVRLFGEYWLGVGFAIGEAVFAFVPAGYNPKATITGSLGAHSDYQEFAVEEFGSSAGGI